MNEAVESKFFATFVPFCSNLLVFRRVTTTPPLPKSFNSISLLSDLRALRGSSFPPPNPNKFISAD